MSDLPIYNCHIHIFTSKHAPRDFLKLYVPGIGGLLSLALRSPRFAGAVLSFLSDLWPFSHNDLLDRHARFMTIGNSCCQGAILEKIQRQYPPDTHFVVLPMDMEFMQLGPIQESIDRQHDDLLELARNSQGRVIPFYAVDPRRDKIVERVRENLVEDRFRGVKLYPNLGYMPYDPVLCQVYEICQERGVPVMSHGTSGGVWKYRLSERERIAISHPRNYLPVLRKFPRLKLCIAHCGGGGEWDKHLKGETSPTGRDRAWVRYIMDMIRSGKFPNLYTDISFTLFSPRVNDLYIDYIDYLKVLLADEKVRTHVLFGSDFYMAKLQQLTEKEVSIALRSRLGEDLYFQIAHHNPRRYLGV